MNEKLQGIIWIIISIIGTLLIIYGSGKIYEGTGTSIMFIGILMLAIVLWRLSTLKEIKLNAEGVKNNGD